MKTTSQKKTSGSELQSRPEQRSTEQTPTSAAAAVTTAPTTEPRARLQIDFRQREANRQLPTQQVLDLLQRRLRPAYELAEVVGKWVWVTFPDRQDQQTTAELSQLGFHWNSRRQSWQHPCGVFKGEPVDPRSKYQAFHAADQRAA